MNFKPDGQFISWVGDADTAKMFNVQIDGVAEPILSVNGEDGNYSRLQMNEEGSSTSDDYFYISVGSNGETSIDTVDAAGAAAHLSIGADGLITFSGDGVKVDNGSTTGQPALLIDNNDVDQIALSIDAENTTVDVIKVDAGPLTSGRALHIDSNSYTDGNVVEIDVDDANTGDSQKTLMDINWNKSGVTGSTNSNSTVFLLIFKIVLQIIVKVV